MLAGPNGAGKSTVYQTRVAPSLSVPFINADDIQRTELKTRDVNAAYEAAQIASARRDDFLKSKRSYATETVFSHESKLNLIRQAKEIGYRVMLFHVGVASPELAIARVAERVKEGGHDVPPEKIRDRYDRNGPLIRQAAHIADKALVFDNSALNKPPSHIMSFSSGKLSFVIPELPMWALKIYGADLEI